MAAITQAQKDAIDAHMFNVSCLTKTLDKRTAELYPNKERGQKLTSSGMQLIVSFERKSEEYWGATVDATLKCIDQLFKMQGYEYHSHTPPIIRNSNEKVVDLEGTLMTIQFHAQEIIDQQQQQQQQPADKDGITPVQKKVIINEYISGVIKMQNAMRDRLNQNLSQQKIPETPVYGVAAMCDPNYTADEQKRNIDGTMMAIDSALESIKNREFIGYDMFLVYTLQSGPILQFNFNTKKMPDANR